MKYPGWIQWDDAAGGLLIAEIRTRVKDHELQILEAFTGYLDCHLGDQFESISTHYRSCNGPARSGGEVSDDQHAELLGPAVDGRQRPRSQLHLIAAGENGPEALAELKPPFPVQDAVEWLHGMSKRVVPSRVSD